MLLFMWLGLGGEVEDEPVEEFPMTIVWQMGGVVPRYAPPVGL